MPASRVVKKRGRWGCPGVQVALPPAFCPVLRLPARLRQAGPIDFRRLPIYENGDLVGHLELTNARISLAQINSYTILVHPTRVPGRSVRREPSDTSSPYSPLQHEQKQAASRRVVGIHTMIPGDGQSTEASSGTSAESLSRSASSRAIEPSEK